MPKFLSSYTPAPGEQVDMTELAKARVKNRRDEAARLRTFGFQGANVTRLNSDWWRSPQSADSELRYALRNLRFRCRDLERNNDWFRKLLSLFEDNVVSSVGIRLQMKIYDQVQDPATKEIVRTLDSRSCELIESAWKEQCEGRNYTVTRKLSDIAADKLTMRSIVRDGDILHRKVRGYDNKFKYAIEILEADYLDDFYSDSRTLWNGNQVRMGVEVNEWKCPEAYWLLVNHPGDFNFGVENQAKRIRIEADEIIHPYVIERPEQSRGYPWGVAAMNRLNMLGGYEEAELVAARLAACKGGFYETDRPQITDVAGGYAGELTDQRVPLEQMEPGINETLPIGMKFKPNDPQHPNANFPAFSQQQLRAAASSVGVSYVSLANDLTGVNFSSIRAGLLDERETYKGVQNFYIQDVKNPCFEDWLEWVLMNGFLGIMLRPKDFDYLNQKIFKARRWDWVDPLKDINAAITAIEGGLDTRSNVIGGRGGDYEDVMNELHYEDGFQKNLDLDFSGAQPASDKGEFPDDSKGGDDDDADVKKTKELQALLIGRKHRLNDADNPRILALEKRLDAILEKLEKRYSDDEPRNDHGQWSGGGDESESDLPGGKFKADKENGGGTFVHEGNKYKVDEDGNFKDKNGKEHVVDENGNAQAVKDHGDSFKAYHEATKEPIAAAGKAFEDKYEQIIKESNGDKGKVYDRISEPGHASHDAAKEAVKKLSTDQLKIIAAAEVGEKKANSIKTDKKLQEIAAKVIAQQVGNTADIHMDHVHEKVGWKKKDRAYSDEEKLWNSSAAAQVRFIFGTRANPKHAEQPRHPESGQWIETEKKVDTLLELFQKLITEKSALPLQQITNPPQLPIPDPGDIRAMIETSIKSINYNELGRQIALSQTNRPWTADEVARHAATIAQKGCRGPFGRSLGLPKGCVMANLSPVDSAPILDYQKNIKPEDLIEDGFESEPHCTILYGLTETDPKPVIKVCKKFGPITATLGLIDVFENEEYDVLKISVASPDAEKLNTALKKLPHENDYPAYIPHITICYVKPGAGKGYAGSDAFKGKVLTFNQVVYSDANKVKTLIELPGKNSAQS